MRKEKIKKRKSYNKSIRDTSIKNSNNNLINNNKL